MGAPPRHPPLHGRIPFRSVGSAPMPGSRGRSAPETRARDERRMSVTPATFRRLALSLPEASEAAHMGHPDFRVRNKIFASLGTPDRDWGTVKLTPEQQGVLTEAEPAVFKPATGAWGRRGWTHVS